MIKKDPIEFYVPAAACIVFLYIAFHLYTQFLYENLLIVPCLLFLGTRLERREGNQSNRILRLPVMMVAWFVFLQLKRSIEHSGIHNLGLFLSTYLFAFPLAFLLRDGDKKKALKIFAGTYLAAAGILAADGLLLVLDWLPEFLSGQVYWTGARLEAFWHPNIAACFFMIGAVFCTAFLSQAASRRTKIGFAVLLVMILGALVLTNCQAVIGLTGGYLGVTVFVAAVKQGRKWFLPGMLAALVLTAGFYAGAEGLSEAHYDALLEKYIQQYSEQLSSEEDLPIMIDPDTGEICLASGNEQDSVENDFGVLNSRTYVWNAARFAIRETPSILYWGIDQPGEYVSCYNFFPIAHMYNAWMECLMGMGLVGFAIAVLFTLMTVWNCLVILLMHHGDIWKRSVALLALCLMAAAVLEPYLFYTTIDYHAIDFLFFLCAGYLAHWQAEGQHRILAAIRSRIPFLKK